MPRHLAFVGVDDGAELGLLVAAMFAILVLAALYLITALFGNLFRKIPVVGPPIGNAFDWAARWARGAIIATLHGLLWAVEKMAHAAAALIVNQYQLLLEGIRSVVDAAEHTRFAVIPREIGAVRAFSVRVASQALVTALEFSRHVEAEARTWAGQAYERAHREIVQLRQQTDATIRVTATRLYQLITNAQARADRQIAAVKAEAEQLFRQAEADAQTAAQLAERDAIRVTQDWADRQGQQAWAGQWAEITAGVTAVLTQLGTDHPDLATQLKAIVAIAPATLAEAETAAAAAVPPLLTALRECVIPDCQDLGQLRDSLHSLADVAFFAALLAWLVQMVMDPAAWARETADVLGPVIDAELATIRGVLGT